MPVTVTSQIIENGPRSLVMLFTGTTSDGATETSVTKVDATSATYANTVQGQAIPPGLHLKVREIVYDVAGETLEIQWNATTPQNMVVLSGFGTMKFDEFGGLPNPGPASLPGADGSILFTTVIAGSSTDASYTVLLRMTKGVPNATS